MIDRNERALVEYVDAQVVDGPVEPGDAVLIGLWLNGLPGHTQRAYRREIENMLAHTGKPISETTLIDIQAYINSLSHLKDTSKARAVAAIKSLYKRLQEGGYIQFNPAALMRLPKVKDTIAERYLTEEQVKAMIDATTSRRDHALVRLFYHTGMRVSELVALRWADVIPVKDGAVLTVQGKGSKTRYIEIGQDMLNELKSLDGKLGKERYVFQSQKSHAGTVPMDARQAERIVAAAAKRAGVEGVDGKQVSPHWLRHANISHTIANGASIVEARDNAGHASIAVTNRYAHSENTGKTSRFIKI